MPEVWGEDAAEFNPHRWFTEKGESISYSPFSKPAPLKGGEGKGKKRKLNHDLLRDDCDNSLTL
jgi:hypothetical protein